jgi:hypothetical protein
MGTLGLTGTTVNFTASRNNVLIYCFQYKTVALPAIDPAMASDHE